MARDRGKRTSWRCIIEIISAETLTESKSMWKVMARGCPGFHLATPLSWLQQLDEQCHCRLTLERPTSKSRVPAKTLRPGFWISRIWFGQGSLVFGSRGQQRGRNSVSQRWKVLHYLYLQSWFHNCLCVWQSAWLWPSLANEVYWGKKIRKMRQSWQRERIFMECFTLGRQKKQPKLFMVETELNMWDATTRSPQDKSTFIFISNMNI